MYFTKPSFCRWPPITYGNWRRFFDGGVFYEGKLDEGERAEAENRQRAARLYLRKLDRRQSMRPAPLIWREINLLAKLLFLFYIYFFLFWFATRHTMCVKVPRVLYERLRVAQKIFSYFLSELFHFRIVAISRVYVGCWKRIGIRFLYTTHEVVQDI